ncbi:HNH endonuclease [Streptomyces olivaceus]|uniref:HNH endonuclease signature motif containing protein n=1 Tax=Streptomyces olivaceus TaxID=47716 RepID=UPI00378F78D4
MARKLTPAEDVLLEATRDEAFVATFWKRVARSEDCWTWTGGKSGPYGQLQYRRQRLLAHRFSWTLSARQACPVGHVIRHRCDNPPCVRPDHLELGSIAQNVRDTYDRRRRTTGNPNLGTTRPNAVLNDELVAILRRRARGGQSIRSIANGLELEYTTVLRAIRGIGWPHVSEPPVPSSRKGKPHRGNFVRNNPDVVNQACRLRDQGLSLQQIADRLGITKTAAFRCCRTQTKEAS